MFKDLDLSGLRRMPEIAFSFRYPLHHADFQEVRAEGRLLGRYAAKPLYGGLLGWLQRPDRRGLPARQG